MSIPLNINGTDYFYPQTGDIGWGPDATDWAVAVTSGMLQKAGGLFILLAEVDFGSNYGLKSIYYKSRTTNAASTGSLRLAAADTIAWRNNANDGNLTLNVGVTDELLFQGEFVQHGPVDYTWPANPGTSGYVLTSNGLGGLAWIDFGGGGPGTGTVTYVDLSVPPFLSVSGNPITTSGTLAVTLSGLALPVANGGTGRTSLTNHGVLIGAGTSGITQSAVGASGTVLKGNTGADPTFGAVDLTADVTGILPVANGGSGQSTITAAFVNNIEAQVWARVAYGL